MCTELFLALVYFTTIVIFNFFLFKLLTSYFNEIIELQRVKRIFAQTSEKKVSIFSQLAEMNKNQNRTAKILKNLQTFSKTDDIIIIGLTYKYLSENITKNSKYDNLFTKMLQNQYLYEKNNI